MTGYGKADVEYAGKKITIEIKSLNSKSLDLSTRLTSLYREKEMEVRRIVGAAVERGKVDVSIWSEKADDAPVAVQLNAKVIAAYAQQMRAIARECGLPEPDRGIWEVLVRLPEVTASQQDVERLTEQEWQVVSEGLQTAIEHFCAFRVQEGAALERTFTQKLDNIAALLESIAPYETSRVEKVKTRLTEALEKLHEIDYDRGRLEQELIYYIEKLDISEEKQRLTNHIRYFRETMREGHGQGKKLGFIAQEMGREINTTGSKSNQAEMQNIVVKMKDELEQIKEQVLNVM